jgi:hypothetical protein
MTYESTVVQIDDRLLTHLQIVIVNKLRRGESFLMSWRDSHEVGDGRSSIWLHSHSSLYFKFDGSRVPAINPVWIDELRASADSSRGLVVTAERGNLQLLENGARVPRFTVAQLAVDIETVVPDTDL